MDIRWRPGILLDHQPELQANLVQLYQSPRLQRAFFERVNQVSGRVVNIEGKVGTLRDMVDYTLMGGEENHVAYKARQAGRMIKGDVERNVLAMLFPKEFVGIDLTAQHIQRILYEKQLAGIGLHPKIMQQLQEQMRDAGNGQTDGGNGH